MSGEPNSPASFPRLFSHSRTAFPAHQTPLESTCQDLLRDNHQAAPVTHRQWKGRKWPSTASSSADSQTVVPRLPLFVKDANQEHLSPASRRRAQLAQAKAFAALKRHNASASCSIDGESQTRHRQSTSSSCSALELTARTIISTSQPLLMSSAALEPADRLQKLMQPMLPGADEGKLHAMISELRVALKEACLSGQQMADQVADLQAKLGAAWASKVGGGDDRVSSSLPPATEWAEQSAEQARHEAHALCQKAAIADAAAAEERERLSLEAAQSRMLSRERSRQVEELEQQLAELTQGSLRAIDRLDALQEERQIFAAEAAELRAQRQVLEAAVARLSEEKEAASNAAQEAKQQVEWHEQRVAELESQDDVAAAKRYAAEVQAVRRASMREREVLQAQLAHQQEELKRLQTLRTSDLSVFTTKEELERCKEQLAAAEEALHTAKSANVPLSPSTMFNPVFATDNLEHQVKELQKQLEAERLYTLALEQKLKDTTESQTKRCSGPMVSPWDTLLSDDDVSDVEHQQPKAPGFESRRNSNPATGHGRQVAAVRTSMHSEINRLKAQLAAAHEAVQQCREGESALLGRLHEQQASFEKLQLQLKRENAVHKARMAELQSSWEAEKAASSKTRQECSDWKQRHQDALTDQSAAEAQLLQQTEKVRKLTAEVSALQSSLSASQQSCRDLVASTQDAERLLHALKSATSTAESQLAIRTEELAIALQESIASQKRLQQAEEDLERRAADNYARQSEQSLEIDDLRQQLGHTKERLSRSEEQLSCCTAELAATRQHVAKVQQAVDDSAKAAVETNAQLAQRKLDLVAMQEKLSASKQALEEADREVVNVRAQSTAQAEELAAARKEVCRNEAKVITAQAECVTAEEKLAEQEAQIAKQEAQLGDLREQLSRAQQQADQAQRSELELSKQATELQASHVELHMAKASADAAQAMQHAAEQQLAEKEAWLEVVQQELSEAWQSAEQAKSLAVPSPGHECPTDSLDARNTSAMPCLHSEVEQSSQIVSGHNILMAAMPQSRTLQPGPDHLQATPAHIRPESVVGSHSTDDVHGRQPSASVTEISNSNFAGAACAASGTGQQLCDTLPGPPSSVGSAEGGDTQLDRLLEEAECLSVCKAQGPESAAQTPWQEASQAETAGRLLPGPQEEGFSGKLPGTPFSWRAGPDVPLPDTITPGLQPLRSPSKTGLGAGGSPPSPAALPTPASICTEAASSSWQAILQSCQELAKIHESAQHAQLSHCPPAAALGQTSASGNSSMRRVPQLELHGSGRAEHLRVLGDSAAAACQDPSDQHASSVSINGKSAAVAQPSYRSAASQTDVDPEAATAESLPCHVSEEVPLPSCLPTYRSYGTQNSVSERQTSSTGLQLVFLSRKREQREEPASLNTKRSTDGSQEQSQPLSRKQHPQHNRQQTTLRPPASAGAGSTALVSQIESSSMHQAHSAVGKEAPLETLLKSVRAAADSLSSLSRQSMSSGAASRMRAQTAESRLCVALRADGGDTVNSAECSSSQKKGQKAAAVVPQAAWTIGSSWRQDGKVDGADLSPLQEVLQRHGLALDTLRSFNRDA